MVTLREAAQQALEAIIELEYSSSTAVGDRMAREAKQALRQALEAEQQAEPVAWIGSSALRDLQGDEKTWVAAWNVGIWKHSIPLYTHPQPAQQPVIPASETCKACGDGQADLVVLRICDKCGSEYAGQAEMDLAKQVKREPLTDEQISQLADKHLDVGDGSLGTHYVYGEIEFARAIEAAHGIGGEKK